MIEEFNKFCARQIVHDRQTIFYSMIHPMRINSHCFLSTIPAYFQSKKTIFRWNCVVWIWCDSLAISQYSIRILFSLFLVYFTKFDRIFLTQRIKMNEKYHRKTMKMLRFRCFNEKLLNRFPWNGIYFVFYSHFEKSFSIEFPKLGVNFSVLFFLLFSTLCFDFNEYLMVDDNKFL